MCACHAVWTTPSTAHDGHDGLQDFEVTHPFHPLSGGRFTLISRWSNWGGDRLVFEDAEGRVRSLPTAWTSLAAADPFVSLSAGRSFFRIEDLVALVSLIRELSTAQEKCKDDSAAYVKGNISCSCEGKAS